MIINSSKVQETDQVDMGKPETNVEEHDTAMNIDCGSC